MLQFVMSKICSLLVAMSLTSVGEAPLVTVIDSGSAASERERPIASEAYACDCEINMY